MGRDDWGVEHEYERGAKMIFEGKTVLVTGGTGSMGKTLVRRVLTGELGTPKKVIVFSRDEAKQHDMRMSYLNRRAATIKTS
jgi:FlaA1/EpsC-like NDP-sugar epimerase